MPNEKTRESITPQRTCSHYCNTGAAQRAENGRLSYKCARCGEMIQTDYYFNVTRETMPDEKTITPRRVREISNQAQFDVDGPRMRAELRTLADQMERTEEVVRAAREMMKQYDAEGECYVMGTGALRTALEKLDGK